MSLLLAACLLTTPAPAALPPAATPIARVVHARNIGIGDPMRRPLLDALRPAIARDLGQPVQFVVAHLRVDGDWAFFMGSVQKPDGGAIDFARTRYREALEEGFFDGPGAMALLQRSRDGGWRVVEFAVGPTDVPFEGWAQEHGAPAHLLP